MKSLLKIIKKITKTISIKTTQIKKKKPSKKKSEKLKKSKKLKKNKKLKKSEKLKESRFSRRNFRKGEKK